MFYNFARISCDLFFAILVSSAIGLPDMKGNYFRYRYDVGGNSSFEPITEDEGLVYLSGQADGMGSYPLPTENFESPAKAQAWLETTRNELYKSLSSSEFLRGLLALIENDIIPDELKETPPLVH